MSSKLVMKHRVNKKKLLICIILDIIGMIPSIIPFLAVLWAPISAWLLIKLFGLGMKGRVASIIGFFEELLPFTNIVPTFTIFWLYETVIEKKLAGFN